MNISSLILGLTIFLSTASTSLFAQQATRQVQQYTASPQAPSRPKATHPAGRPAPPAPTRAAQVHEPANPDPDWTKDIQPFRIAGNLYYVGSYDLSAYLITTPQGHILINTGIASSASMIQRHIESLGLKPQDIKLLMTNHAHYDHVGAMAQLKRSTGAKMLIHAADAPELSNGGSTDYALKKYGRTFAPVIADRLLHDNDTVKLGGMNIKVIALPGHTKGACGFLFDVKDSAKTYRVFIANMPSILSEAKFPTMSAYPNIGKDYGHTFKTMKQVQFDLWLAAHASQFNLHEKHKPGSPYNPQAFADRAGYDASVGKLEKVYREKMKTK